VIVVGRIRKFERPNIEHLLGGWRWDVSPAVVSSFSGQPVIIADSVRIVGGR
jgi:hypothetical protein